MSVEIEASEKSPEIFFGEHACAEPELCSTVTVGIRNPRMLEYEDTEGELVAAIDMSPHDIVGFCADLLRFAHEQIDKVADLEDDE